MSDYIEQSVIERLLAIAAAADGEENRRTWARAMCIAHITPTADVAPVKHGTWEIMPETKTRRFCACCRWDVPEYGKFYAYCPNCGAKMDGGDDDDGRGSD